MGGNDQAPGNSLLHGPEAPVYLHHPGRGTVRGPETKSITQSTVFIAFHKALELEGIVTGPKKLGTFGASYLYPVFLELGVICPDNSIQEKESIL